MRRHWIMYGCLYTVPGHVIPETVTVLDPHHVLMPYGYTRAVIYRLGDIRIVNHAVIYPRNGAPAGILKFKLRQFQRHDGSLQRVKAAIIPLQFIMVLPALAIVAHSP